MHLVAIDPGVVTGWALFRDMRVGPVLASCGLASLEARGVPTVGPERLVIERPRTRTGSRVPANDLITLALNAGEWAGRYHSLDGVVAEYVTPEAWKGSVSKDVSHARIWARLSEVERAAVDLACRGMAVSKRHNVLDAVGIGLFAVGRRA